MFCQNCGKEIPDGTKFCPECGLNPEGKTFVQETSKNQAVRKSVWTCFCDVVKSFYHFVVDGRLSRKHFWSFLLFYLVFAAVAGFVEAFLFGDVQGNPIVDYYIGIMMLPVFSVEFKRMHDVGKPAGFAFIPIYNLILFLSAGEKQSNKYGEASAS